MGEEAVLIVGAGPTGLSMAIELERLGIPFRLIDRAETPAQFSRAFVVQARTLEQFERYGLAETFVNSGRKLRQASMISDGKEIATIPFDKIPGRYPFVLSLGQNQTERILAEFLQSKNVKIERGTELVKLANGVDKVHVQLRRADGPEENAVFRWAVGCDGAHSQARKCLGSDFIGDTVPLSFFLADVELSGSDVPQDELKIYLRDGNVLFIGQLTENLHRLVVATHPKTDAPENPSLADFQTALDDIAAAGLTASNPAWLARFHINERQVEHYRTGNVFLAGDAAHIHSPVGGQGMNTGIQDAANLAWKLAAVNKGADADTLLVSYDEERGEVGEAVLKGSSRGLSLATTENSFLQSVRDLLAPHITQLPQIQEMMLGMISETAIYYRDSSIVRDNIEEGSLRAGDRVPNPEILMVKGGRQRLLAGLDEARHLALIINTGENALPPLLRSVKKVFLDSNHEDIRELFGEEPQIALVRPDGYLGYRGSPDNIPALENYARITGLW